MRVQIGNTGKEFATIKPSPGRSEFQTEYAKSIARRTDFAFFCCDPTCMVVYAGPVVYTWYDKAGKLHGERVGQRKVLGQVVV